MLMIVMTMIGNKDNNEIPHMYISNVFFYVELTPSQMKVVL